MPHASILGDPVVKTPTFDRLVREGVLFTNAYASAPSCTPSRFAVATGQYHWRLKTGMNLGGSLPKDAPVYPDLLKAHGYWTGFARKGALPSKHLYRGSDPFGKRYKNFAAFLRDRPAGTPFCFWYGAGEPHRPYEWQSGIRHGMKPGEIRLPACLPDHPTIRTDLCDYYYQVECFDHDAARMIAMLEKSGELGNTIVVMSSDNGMPFPRCKATLYDTGTHVPLAICWGARVKGGRTISDFVSLCDLAPTFLQAAGVTPPPEMTGRSLLPILMSDKSGRTDPTRFYVLSGMERHVFANPSRAIRTVDWLYILNRDPVNWRTGRGNGPVPTYDFTVRHWPKDAEAFSFNIDPSPTKQYMLLHSDDPAVKSLYAAAFGTRPVEELYELRSDPGQLRNRAAEAKLQRTKRNLQSLLKSKLIASHDPSISTAGYDVRELEGWTVLINFRLMEESRFATERAIELMRNQLKTIIDRVPLRAVSYLQTIPLWLSPEYSGECPRAEYHPDAGWLQSHGRNPAMAKGVEFSNIHIFPKECRRMPLFILHELAHAYHDQVFGFDDPQIKALYERARQSGSYAMVSNYTGKTMRAYAMTNCKEYFAETTESFFGRNDFYPFNRDELKTHDPQMYRLLQQYWGCQE